MKKAIAAVLLWIINDAAIQLFRSFPAFSFPVYRSGSKAWIGLLSALTGPFRIAV
ncbi:MAG: hypothetical protein IKF51_01995 [Solobacterium sp.]|nr:hypothetical protein [Solobacterium sp.]